MVENSREPEQQEQQQDASARISDGERDQRDEGAAAANLPVPRAAAGTINALLDLSCALYSGQPALNTALDPPMSYAALHEHILALALRLRQAGVERGHRVALFGENSPNWVIAFLAALRLGAQAVPIFPETPETEVRRILARIRCRALFVDRRRFATLYELNVPNALIALDDGQDACGLLATRAFSDFAQEGFALLRSEGQDPFPEVLPDETACILHTPGVSGPPRALPLSHGNLCANAYAVAAATPLSPGTVLLSTLPLSHAFELSAGLLMPIIQGCRVAYMAAPPTPRVLESVCACERPQVILTVPAVVERVFRGRVRTQLEKRRLMGFFCRFDTTRRLFFRKAGLKLMAFFGGRLELLGIGGAGLDPETERFLREAELPFLVGYGLSEAAFLVTFGPAGDPTIEPGSAGRVLPDMGLRIASPDPDSGVGEIQARGPNIMRGYLDDPEADRAALTEDGWLATGDLGRLDEAGNLFVLGRAAAVITLAGGESVSPEAIEERLNRAPFVRESLLVENNGLLEALIHPDYNWLDSRTKGHTAAKRREYLHRLLGELRRDINETLPLASRISRVLERPMPFARTPTLAIRRFLY